MKREAPSESELAGMECNVGKQRMKQRSLCRDDPSVPLIPLQRNETVSRRLVKIEKNTTQLLLSLSVRLGHNRPTLRGEEGPQVRCGAFPNVNLLFLMTWTVAIFKPLLPMLVFLAHYGRRFGSSSLPMPTVVGRCDSSLASGTSLSLVTLILGFGRSDS